MDENKPKGFDLRVTHRDEKTGLVTHTDPYTLRVMGEGSAKVRYWERPAGSGNLFDKKGKPAGRWDKTQPEGKRLLADVEHVAVIPVLTQDQKLRQQMTEDKAKIAQLEREVASIKAEKEKARPAPAPQKKDLGA
jgi:hypothetical protein